jgi:hypothetical protein
MEEIKKNVISQEEYGDNYKSHILDIYKIYIEMADRISNRRQNANSFFLTINSAIIGFGGYVKTSKLNDNNWIIALAGIVLCYVWYRLIRSYKDLNTGKYKVIHEIERHLPISPFDMEWELIGKGKNSKLYLPFTRVESKIPIVFGIIHLITILLSILW